MHLYSDSNNKKHVMAERMLDPGIPSNLCNLFIYQVLDYTVLSLYSALSKNFVGYKVLMNTPSLDEDPLMSQTYNSKFMVSSDPDFELIPKAFNADVSDNFSPDLVVNTALKKTDVHLAYGIEKYSESLESPAVWLFVHENIVSVIISNHKSLVFANSFTFNDQTELLYFVVSALNITDIKQDDARVYLDYAAMNKFGLSDFLQPYFKSVEPLELPFENPDPELEILPVLLAPNHLASLCV